jgi:uncharacterized protein (TIGR03435 family)
MKIFFMAAVAIVHAQSFEVASIKPSVVRAIEGSGRSRIEHTADSLTMRNVDLKECVQWAYGVEYYQIPAANSLDGKGYDILAKAAGAVPVSQLRLMLRQLLKDRFKLTVHQETKTLPVYALTVAKGGAEAAGGERRRRSPCRRIAAEGAGWELLFSGRVDERVCDEVIDAARDGPAGGGSDGDPGILRHPS